LVENLSGWNWMHGLRVNTDLGLPCLPTTEGLPDVVLRSEVQTVSPGPNPLTSDDESKFVLGDHAARSVVYADHNLRIDQAQDGTDVVARFDSVQLQFSIDLSRSPIRIDASASSDEWIGWIAVLVQGAVMAAAVEMTGRAAFHANTVDVDGNGILIGGASGAGKTVATALLALRGHTLVADDVSVVSPGQPVYPGLLEMRVRTWENPLGQLLVQELCTLPGVQQRSTVDWRVGVRLGTDPSNTGVMPTRMLLPTVDDTIDQPELQTLSGAAAVTSLLPAKRLVGWKDPRRLVADFGHCADLAIRIPIQRLLLPRISGRDPAQLHLVAALLDDLLKKQ
jgi:HPr Serine kinase C-terminal domain